MDIRKNAKKYCKMLEDIIYFSTLILCITVASQYKNVANIDLKRHYGTGIGVLISFLICGHYLYHTILMVWLNIIIVKCCDRRFVHQISLAYTWAHLIYLHIILRNAPYVILLHQTVALRLVGIAFEMYTADKLSTKPTSSVRINSGEGLKPTTADIISYAFFFIGLHKGPYYRYKIYHDYLQGPFGSLGDFRKITEYKMKKLFICAGVYSLLRMKYSTQIFFDDDFYEYDTEYRFLSNIPLLVMFFLKSTIIALLCSSVCTEAGFGVFPAKTMPKPGHGPSMRYSLLKLAISLITTDIDLQQAMQQEYNFSMLRCFNNEKLLIGPRMKDTMRSWDMPLRYWFWMNIYKPMSRTSKEIRSACTFLAWAMWAGPSLQTAIVSATLWVYINMETEYGELYNTEGSLKVPWDIGFSIMRMLCLVYLTPCFIIDDASIILKYYNSIFWAFHGVLFVFIVGVIVINKSR